jgi:hypothetical protein
MRHLAALALVALIASACGASDDATDGGRPPLPTGATTAGAGAMATIEGERFVAVRTLPASALSAEKLESAGVAQEASGEAIAMARARDARVAPWELVSATAGGWLVWRPAIILDALAGAGADAVLVDAEAVLWPDACLDAAEPGEICAQVVTPGYRIIIERGGQRVEYHADLRGNVRTLSP